MNHGLLFLSPFMFIPSTPIAAIELYFILNVFLYVAISKYFCCCHFWCKVAILCFDLILWYVFRYILLGIVTCRKFWNFEIEIIVKSGISTDYSKILLALSIYLSLWKLIIISEEHSEEELHPVENVMLSHHVGPYRVEFQRVH